MDQPTRNKLRAAVTACRRLLEDSVRDELQGKFGVYLAPKGDSVQVEDGARMTHLGGEEQAARGDILGHFGHIRARGFKPRESLDQLVREVAFTHLNRFCAYKMMDARKVFVDGERFRDAVGKSVDSQGVRFYLADHPDEERLFNGGNQELVYRHFLDWLGARLSGEIGVLFSPDDPANRLYPPQRVLDQVLALLNDESLADIWSQDETVGWVYQYFTPKELRDQARDPKRGGSQAPRNSYELAFRNQFFTPRYVVEFLTDNTLGRIWYEMRKGDTKLKDQCRYLVRRPADVFLAEGESAPHTDAPADDLPQAELLKLPVYIPHRPKRDPRDLKVLDPACGSGHFLLYCFDLLLVIYEEAYADPDLGPALRRNYPTLDGLRHDVPRLILMHNLHGIDIDLRATQIASLALWLRCQRAYQAMDLKRDRPAITRSNLVCAEPMPGDTALLRDFVARLDPPLLGQLVEVVFDKMKLAGEAGSLLKIEDEIKGAVAEAERQFRVGGIVVRQSLFDATPQSVQLRFDVSGLGAGDFFTQAEAKVVAALRDYAEKAQAGERLQRRLFAEDAVRGFAFVDLCHQKFDVVLMNPPFGDGSKLAKATIDKSYPRTKNDLYAAFVERGLAMLTRGGMLGAITSRTGFFLSSFQKWREEILLGEATPAVFADLGDNVLDTAEVETAAYCFEAKRDDAAVTTFIRLLHANDKDAALRGELVAPGPLTFHVSKASLGQIDSSPFAYWITERVRRVFRESPIFESDGRTAQHGLSTKYDLRFIRCWWEVAAISILDGQNGPRWRDDLGTFKKWCLDRTFSGKKWIPIVKGGKFSLFYRDVHAVVDWERNGANIEEYVLAKYPYLGTNAEWVLHRENDYFQPALTWPLRGIKLSVQAVPAGCCFSVAGKIATSIHIDEMFPLLGLMSSSSFDYMVGLFAGKVGGVQYEIGLIGKLPVPPINEKLAALAKVGTALRQQPFQTDELSHLFVSPCVPLGAPELRAAELEITQHCLDEFAYEAYGLSTADRAAMELAGAPTGEADEPDGDDAEDQEPDPAPAGDGAERGRDLLSYAVGCAFGRFDVRYATGERPVPPLPDPFDPLPVCSPGMLQGADGLPLSASPPGYPLTVEWGGILPDDPDHPADIVRRVQEVFDLLKLPDAVGRDYFRKSGKGGFWDNHVARYSKSRRKAPIYWLLQSSRKNYGLWLYYHRLDKDLLFKALQPAGPVQTKLKLERNRLDALRAPQASTGGTEREAKRVARQLTAEVEKQEDFVSELIDFEAKLRRAADLHLDPDLNDGVVLNIASLWELVPWKVAKEYWSELLAGKYEWSSIGRQLREKGMIPGGG